jgi:hypothetical protein
VGACPDFAKDDQVATAGDYIQLQPPEPHVAPQDVEAVVLQLIGYQLFRSAPEFRTCQEGFTHAELIVAIAQQLLAAQIEFTLR